LQLWISWTFSWWVDSWWNHRCCIHSNVHVWSICHVRTILSCCVKRNNSIVSWLCLLQCSGDNRLNGISVAYNVFRIIISWIILLVFHLETPKTHLCNLNFVPEPSIMMLQSFILPITSSGRLGSWAERTATKYGYFCRIHIQSILVVILYITVDKHCFLTHSFGRDWLLLGPFNTHARALAVSKSALFFWFFCSSCFSNFFSFSWQQDSR